MPLVAGLLAAAFELFFAFFAKKLALGVAAAAAFVAVSFAAWASVRLAMSGIASGLGVVAPPALISAVSDFMPANLHVCITMILLVDTVMSNYDFWKQHLPVVFQLARG